MGTSALRRLVAEYKQILKNAPDGIIAGPIKEENYFEWEAAITGPEGTLFEDGVFMAKLVFPQVRSSATLVIFNDKSAKIQMVAFTPICITFC